ncbi:hypothetical protein Aperf_G00000123640 [Anoplocephala perfoliata]
MGVMGATSLYNEDGKQFSALCKLIDLAFLRGIGDEWTRFVKRKHRLPLEPVIACLFVKALLDHPEEGGTSASPLQPDGLPPSQGGGIGDEWTRFVKRKHRLPLEPVIACLFVKALLDHPEEGGTSASPLQTDGLPPSQGITSAQLDEVPPVFADMQQLSLIQKNPLLQENIQFCCY